MARRAGVRHERKEKKGGALRRCTPLKATRSGGRGRRKLWVGTAAKAVGTDKVVGAAVRTRSAWPGCLYSDCGTDRWAPHGFFLQFIQNWLNFKNLKWVPYLAQKIPNFCMQLSWDIMNNFLYYGDIQFPT
jgi:hypothetical protein